MWSIQAPFHCLLGIHYEHHPSTFIIYPHSHSLSHQIWPQYSIIYLRHVSDVWKGKIASLNFYTKGSFVIKPPWSADNSGLCALYSTSSNITYMSELSCQIENNNQSWCLLLDLVMEMGKFGKNWEHLPPAIILVHNITVGYRRLCHKYSWFMAASTWDISWMTYDDP